MKSVVSWGWGREREITKGQKETFESNKYVHYFDYGDIHMGIYICQNLHILMILYMSKLIFYTLNMCQLKAIMPQ